MTPTDRLDADDLDLLDAWHAGDADAGSVLFDRHFDAIHRFFSTKVPHLADDLVQHTFAACLRARPQLRGRASFRTYLFTVARNALYNAITRRRETAELDPSASCCVDLDPSPSVVLAHRQQHRLLLEGLRRLPIDLQIALELHYFEDLTGPELAAILGVPEGTVRGRLRRGRELLRERLQELERQHHVVRSTTTDLSRWAADIRAARSATP